MDSAPFASPIANFYMTDPISRGSYIMAECTAQRRALVAAAASAAGAKTGTGG
jgi:NADH-quinone oxidoreductase subunit G